MLVELTDKEIQQLGRDRWVTPKQNWIIIYLFVAGGILACGKYLVVDFYSIESELLELGITVGLVMVCLAPAVAFFRNMTKAGNRLLTELNG